MLKRRFVLVVTIPMLALAASACALRGQARHVATLSAVGVYEACAVIQDTEQTLFETGQLTAEQHRAFNVKLVSLLKAGRAFTQVIREWPQSRPAPPELIPLVASIGDLTRAVRETLPSGSAQALLLGQIAAVQAIVLDVLSALTGGTP